MRFLLSVLVLLVWCVPASAKYMYVNAGDTNARNAVGYGTSPLTPMITPTYCLYSAAWVNDDTMVVYGYSASDTSLAYYPDLIIGDWGTHVLRFLIGARGNNDGYPKFNRTITFGYTEPELTKICHMENILFPIGTVDISFVMFMHNSPITVRNCSFIGKPVGLAYKNAAVTSYAALGSGHTGLGYHLITFDSCYFNTPLVSYLAATGNGSPCTTIFNNCVINDSAAATDTTTGLVNCTVTNVNSPISLVVNNSVVKANALICWSGGVEATQIKAITVNNSVVFDTQGIYSNGIIFLDTCATPVAVTLTNVSNADPKFIFPDTHPFAYTNALEWSSPAFTLGYLQRRQPLNRVLFSEIAWMGTQGSTTQEWFELYNSGSTATRMEGWSAIAIDTSDMTFSANVSCTGTATAGGWWLSQRGTTYWPISDIHLDMKSSYANGLLNGGNNMYLFDANGVMSDSLMCGSGWWGGNNTSPKYTMERISYSVENIPSNWGTNNGVIRNGTDSYGNVMNATPRAQNSIYTPPVPPVTGSVSRLGYSYWIIFRRLLFKR